MTTHAAALHVPSLSQLRNQPRLSDTTQQPTQLPPLLTQTVLSHSHEPCCSHKWPLHLLQQHHHSPTHDTGALTRANSEQASKAQPSLPHRGKGDTATTTTTHALQDRWLAVCRCPATNCTCCFTPHTAAAAARQVGGQQLAGLKNKHRQLKNKHRQLNQDKNPLRTAQQAPLLVSPLSQWSSSHQQLNPPKTVGPGHDRCLCQGAGNSPAAAWSVPGCRQL